MFSGTDLLWEGHEAGIFVVIDTLRSQLLENCMKLECFQDRRYDSM